MLTIIIRLKLKYKSNLAISLIGGSMSLVEQTRDVLHIAEKVHKDLSSIFEKLGKESDKIRIKILLDYLSEHEMFLEKCLVEYENSCSDKILNNWFKYGPEKKTITEIAEIDISPDSDIDDIVEKVLLIDDRLIEFYSEMKEQTNCSCVKEAFDNLVEMEKREKIKLVKNTARFQDI